MRPETAPAHGRFQGEAQWSECLRQALASAVAQSWSPLILCDEDFAGWPLRETAVVQGLHDWARAGCKMLLLARDYPSLERGHPRFVTWRRQWDHRVECRAVAAGAPLPSALWGPGGYVWRVDPGVGEFVAGREPRSLQDLKAELLEVFKAARRAFPASTLGL